MRSVHSFPRLSAEEAAALIPDGAFVGFSGFTPAGAAKVVPRALAARARALHEKGQPFKIRVLTGASTGKAPRRVARAGRGDLVARPVPVVEDAARPDQQAAGAVRRHAPVARAADARRSASSARWTSPSSRPPRSPRDGRVYLSTSIGASPTFLQCGREGHHRDQPLPLAARVGDVRHRHAAAAAAPRADPDLRRDDAHRLAVRRRRSAGRSSASSSTASPTTWRRSIRRPRRTTGSREYVVEFLLNEMRAGRIPQEFLPLQSGVGNVANAVLAGLGENPDIPPFTMYTEVFQDSCVELMERRPAGRREHDGAHDDARSKLERVYDDIDFFVPRIVLRPQELTNHPGIIRRLGRHHDEHGARGRHLRPRELDARARHADDERHRRQRRLHAQRLPVDLHVPVDEQGRGALDHRADGHARRPQRALGAGRGHRAGARRPARARGDGARAGDHRRSARTRRTATTCSRYLETARMGHIRHDLSRASSCTSNFMDTGSMLPGVKVAA